MQVPKLSSNWINYWKKKYTVDNADYLGSSKENHTIKKKYIKIKSFLFSKYTCFLLLGMLQFNT